MERWRRWVVGAVLTAVLVVFLVPETWLRATDVAQQVIDRVYAAVSRPIPEPVLVGIGMLVLLLVSFAVIFGTVRLFTSVGTKTGENIAGWYDRITPDSPQTKALVFMLAFVVVFIAGVGAFAPWLATTLAEDTGVGDVVGDIQEGRYSGNLESLFADDAIEAESPTVRTKANGTDTDGDGLPDAWERRNRAPGGAALPGAEVGELDLYVQINYGENVTTLSGSEKERLREVWAEMPVEGENGTEGIDIHLIDQRDAAGRIGREVLIDAQRDVDRFYTEDRLGPRYCVYHQVVLGQVRSRETIGYAETPGYAAVVDGSSFANYNGRVPFRVALLTHSLLHTIVGPVDSGVHTDGGWLDYPDRSNEYLPQSVADELSEEGFATTQAYRQRCQAATTTQNSSR